MWKITSDFQCLVCGAIFTTAEDQQQHLDKENTHKEEQPESPLRSNGQSVKK